MYAPRAYVSKTHHKKPNHISNSINKIRGIESLNNFIFIKTKLRENLINQNWILLFFSFPPKLDCLDICCCFFFKIMSIYIYIYFFFILFLLRYFVCEDLGHYNCS